MARSPGGGRGFPQPVMPVFMYESLVLNTVLFSDHLLPSAVILELKRIP